MLEHGGRLLRAAREYAIPLEAWLDLSTGVSPFAWPLPSIPPSAWQRLPEDDDGLIEIACDYYRAPHLLPVAGSQAAIQVLPWLRAHSRVGVLAPGYAEHAHAWRQAGHQVECMAADRLLASVGCFDVVVVIHPNNPDGMCFDPATLENVRAQLAPRGGWLIVDEAFMDATPGLSLAACSARQGLIVLRSVGKFFGLAGARAGFVCAAPALLEIMRERLGPWTLSGPTRYILRDALADRAWQAQARTRLRSASDRLSVLLAKHGWPPEGGCALFQWCRHDQAGFLQRELAQRGIYTRLFDTPPSVRFGLPPDDAAFARLAHALSGISR